MSVVDIKDLQEHAADLVARVEEDGETIEIVHRGRVAALLVPSPAPETDADERAARRAQTAAALAAIDRLGEQIAKVWPKDVSSVDAIRDVRRDL